MVDKVKKALQHVRNRSGGAPITPGLAVTLNFHPDLLAENATTIELIARDGVYRSQFETGTSNGGLTAYPGGDRWLWETEMFGGAYDDAEKASRPKYGALNHLNDPFGGSIRFGSCHFRLLPHILERTTFCYPDSFHKPTDFGVAGHMNLIALAHTNVINLDPDLDNCIEAHVHGLLRVREDALVLDPSYRGSEIEKIALGLGCRVEWHQGFRLSVTRADECGKFRGGTSVAEAIVSISKDGFVTPRELGKSRAKKLDYQTAKWVWHCLAKLGRTSPRLL